MKARFKIRRVCGLILYVTLSLRLIAAHILSFYVRFQQLVDFSRQRGEFAGQSLQIGAGKPPPVAPRERRIALVRAVPVARNALLQSGLDHLDDVASGERDLFAQQRDRAVLGPHLLGEVLDFARARARAARDRSRNASSMAPPCPFRAKRLPFGESRRMISPASTRQARCRRSVAGAMPCARIESSLFDGKHDDAAGS